jgi:hypothetical protein
VIPIVIVAVGFHSCEVRHGGDKEACDKGSVDKCLEVAKAYDPDDPNELIPFLFDYAVVAKREYGKACELGSAQACWRFAEITRQGGGAFASTSSETDERHGYTTACEAKIEKACAKLHEEFGVTLDGGT